VSELKRNYLQSDPELLGLALNILKERMSSMLDVHYNSTVRYGPFKGLKLGKPTWSLMDRGSMLLGLYEQEVQNAIVNYAKGYSTFVNIGSADGFYALGVLTNNLFSNAICFEVSDVEKEVFWENSKLNSLSDKVTMFGAAEVGFWEKIPSAIASSCLVLCDIEGGEFTVFDELALNHFRKSTVIIELHEFMVSDGVNQLASLIKRSTPHFKISYLTTTSRDFSKFTELHKLQDNLRWLIASEGRGELQKWLVLEPKSLT
jgi:hypothetical protein